jgi:hypothetical protein
MNMTCKEFQEVAHELLHAESAAVESVRLGLAHTLVCEECAAYLAAERSLDEQLGELAAVYAESQAPPSVERAVMTAFRARLDTQRSKYRAPWTAAMSWRWAAPLALAAGAAALLLAGMLHHRGSTSGPGITAHGTPAQSQTAPATAVVNAPAASDAAQSTSADAAWTNGFVALPDSATGDSLDGGAILRIEMPASALSSLGLPTTGVEGDQLVPADVVVGQDGTLRAIRLATD